MEQKRLEALEADPNGFFLRNHPRCPHCGHECGLSENGWWSLCEEDTHEKTCPNCNLEFRIKTRVDYMFSTDEQDDA